MSAETVEKIDNLFTEYNAIKEQSIFHLSHDDDDDDDDDVDMVEDLRIHTKVYKRLMQDDVNNNKGPNIKSKSITKPTKRKGKKKEKKN